MQETLLERIKSWVKLGLTEYSINFINHEHTFNTVVNNGEKFNVLTSIETNCTTRFHRKAGFSIKETHLILNIFTVLYGWL